METEPRGALDRQPRPALSLRAWLNGKAGRKELPCASGAKAQRIGLNARVRGKQPRLSFGTREPMAKPGVPLSMYRVRGCPVLFFLPPRPVITRPSLRMR